MKFYDRKNEIKKIKQLQKMTGSNILVIMGRRRIGKTRLLLETMYSNKNVIYFFVKRKTLKENLIEWSNELKSKYDIIGNFDSLENFLLILFKLSEKRKITVIFDEIQNLYYYDKSVFSVFQKVFDLNKERGNLLLIFTGSVYTLMEKIFKNHKEPLFGRSTEIMELSYLPISSLREILKDYKMFSGENLLHLYTLFDGVPHYIEEFMKMSKGNFKKTLKSFIVDRDILWNEGEYLLRGEFGGEYSVYFSILSAIAKGKRTRNEIILDTGIKEVGGYLNKLEKIYLFINRHTPILKKSQKTKLSQYYINDNFIEFYFRFLDKYKSWKEWGMIEKVFENIWKELPSYEGYKLERMVKRIIIEENPLKMDFTQIGKYWDRKGNFDIDLLVLNDKKKTGYVIEIKRKKRKININKIKENINNIEILKQYKLKPILVYLDNQELKFSELSPRT